jgi:hypothetical protein
MLLPPLFDSLKKAFNKYKIKHTKIINLTEKKGNFDICGKHERAA